VGVVPVGSVGVPSPTVTSVGAVGVVVSTPVVGVVVVGSPNRLVPGGPVVVGVVPVGLVGAVASVVVVVPVSGVTPRGLIG
jgi:hypothetical protein